MLGKLDFVDRRRFKRGVSMNVKTQLLTVAIKEGKEPDLPSMGKAVDRAGYVAVEAYSLDIGKLKSHPFKKKKQD